MCLLIFAALNISGDFLGTTPMPSSFVRSKLNKCSTALVINFLPRVSAKKRERIKKFLQFFKHRNHPAVTLWWKIVWRESPTGLTGSKLSELPDTDGLPGLLRSTHLSPPIDQLSNLKERFGSRCHSTVISCKFFPHFAEPPANIIDPTCSQIHPLESAVPELLHCGMLQLFKDTFR